jgi:UDP-N-acetyl-D-glucosamine dehydrogenase
LAADDSPNYSYIFNCMEAIASNLRKEQLIIIESTLVPETTSKDILPILNKSGLAVGKDFYLAYSPERIDPGNNLYQLQNIPKLVSGYSKKCAELAEQFYSQLSIKVFRLDRMDVAELSKVLENTYRDVNIALINEMAQICHAHCINIWDVIEAAASKPFGFQPFYPGPGVGGHCIPKDSKFYSIWAKQAGIAASLSDCARKINDAMPNYIITRLEELLERDNKRIEGSTILVLGVTYKPDVNDLRESPTIKILELLLAMGAHVDMHDPYVRQLDVNGQLVESIDFDSVKNTKYDCIVLAVAHSCYKNYKEYHASSVFDLTNTIDKDVSNLSII